MEIAFHSRSPTVTQPFLTLAEKNVSFLSYRRAFQLPENSHSPDLCPNNTGGLGFSLCMILSMQESMNAAAENMVCFVFFGTSSTDHPLLYLQPADLKQMGPSLE